MSHKAFSRHSSTYNSNLSAVLKEFIKLNFFKVQTKIPESLSSKSFDYRRGRERFLINFQKKITTEPNLFG